MFPAHTAPPHATLLQQAAQAMQAGNLAGAEQLVRGVLRSFPNDSNALHLMGLVLLQQDRALDALPVLEQAIQANPRHALIHLNLAKALAGQDRFAAATASFRQALALQPALPEAHLELGRMLHRSGDPGAAEKTLRAGLKQTPDLAPLRLALGAALIDLERADEAELVLRRGMAQTQDRDLGATFHHYLGLALVALERRAEALESFEAAQALAPELTGLDMLRAREMENLDRHQDALALYEHILAREPQNTDAHYAYNSLLYRLGRDGDFLTSFDRVDATPAILITKAQMMIIARRGDGALDAFETLCARDPGDSDALSGKGVAYSLLGRHDEARNAIGAALALVPDHPAYLSHMAGALINAGDAEQAAHFAQKALAHDPVDQTSLAMLATAWRMMDDPREEAFSGYQDMVQLFDLEPPKGWTDMDAFNRELAALLDDAHPATRNYFDQTQRGGTKTAGDILDSRHPMIAALRGRIEEAVDRYIRQMRGPADHPLLRRRSGDFRFSGSWSSRLADCGYHVDHIHPKGWISSCYYVAVPDAVRDESARQGWIKFGQPAARQELAPRRAVQPAPGRLVLFPSYMWHGTNPFRSEAVRTTIAFDVVPQ